MNLSAFRPLFLSALAIAVVAPAPSIAGVGILVIAPDRGFAGNEEARNALAATDAPVKEIVFVTDQKSRAYLDEAFETMKKRRVNDLAVLPLFLSKEEPRWQLARQWLREGICEERVKCRFSAPFGDSYLAVDLLNQSMREMAGAHRKTLLLIGNSNEGDSEKLQKAWTNIATRAPAADRFDNIAAYVWTNNGDIEAQSKALKSMTTDEELAILSWHLGPKMDSMMSFDGLLSHRILHGAGTRYRNVQISVDDLSLWMQRETNRYQIRSSRDVGIVVLAHGADFHWNQAMRSAINPLESDYAIELAFSMADRVSIANALGKLEERGMRGAVIVRVFGIEDSFRRNVENMIGTNIERSQDDTPEYLSAGGGMPGMMSQLPIRSPLVVTTVGGLDDHPLFAEGLLARAEEVSTDPARETLIVVGHGRGDDRINNRWMENLASLRVQMLDNGGDVFRAIHVGTWREDWPEKRDVEVAQIRGYAEEALAAGGRVIMIPARTASGGPARNLLPDVDFVEAEGFAPHPLFTKWLDAEIRESVEMLLTK